jgi:hypothetical protein
MCCHALPVAEVRSEIKRHASELEALNEALPAGIAVGLVFINSLKVGRQRKQATVRCCAVCLTQAETVIALQLGLQIDVQQSPWAADA